MKTNITFLAVIFIVLLVVAILIVTNSGERSINPEEIPQLIAVDSAAVDGITITRGSTTIELRRSGNTWKIEKPVSYRADAKKVGDLLHELSAVKASTVVSSKPEKHGVFQVDSTGTELRIMEHGKPVVHLVVGKNGPDFTSRYMRLADENEVWMVTGLSYGILSDNPSDWRDRMILDVKKDLVRRVQFQYADTVFVLNRDDSLWTVDGEPADQGRVESFLSSLASLSADEFLDTMTTAPGPPRCVLDVDGTQIRFYPGGEGNLYFLQTSVSPQWFQVSEWRVNALLKKKMDFKTR
ncbi:MAG: DUF4340 domain-containing protein [Chlorobi bacterium]|nr:DUF4340 domain-containing protein [Chlorobiota bacterium]